MMTRRMHLTPAVLLALVALGSAGCTVQPTADHQPMTDTWRAAVTDTILALVAASAGVNFFDDCQTAGDAAWLPDQPPLVHFSAEDQVIRLHDRNEIIAYCNRIAQGRVSTQEEVVEQSVHLPSSEVAYVVSRSNQTTQWQDGRNETIPVVETAIAARQAGRWRILYKHLSWRETAPGAR